jgi:hypothetical protein
VGGALVRYLSKKKCKRLFFEITSLFHHTRGLLLHSCCPHRFVQDLLLNEKENKLLDLNAILLSHSFSFLRSYGAAA